MELTCPKCGTPFAINDADYASIVDQVKNKEFNKELDRRIAELQRTEDAKQEAAKAKAASELNAKLSEKDLALANLQAEIDSLKQQMETVAERKQLEMTETINKKDLEIERLNERISQQEMAKQHEVEAALMDKEKEIMQLKSDISQKDSAQELAVLRVKTEAEKTILEKTSEISRLNSQIEIDKTQAAQREADIAKQYEDKLQFAKDEINRIKEFKAKLSTKMIGESLEQHCNTEFNKVRNIAFPNAYFEKDNDAAGGNKGDFIFRDFVDGQEYVSIMFEMKNEADTGISKKHKNEDFFAKLDKDRRDKNCEYAVLVSLLEPDNDLYNEGIVDVSHKYDKMFVIRPQFFMPIIGILSQASRKSVTYLRELEAARSQNVDVSNFEAKLLSFRDSFSKQVKWAVDNHNKAIDSIKSTIKTLQSIVDSFEKSDKHLAIADKKLEEDLTIKKLTYNNPTMKAKFEEARKLADNSSDLTDK